MSQYRALRTFTSREHGLIRAGIIVTLADSYAAALNRGHVPMVEKVDALEPNFNAAIPSAPRTKDVGNEEGDGQGSSVPDKQVEELSQDQGDGTAASFVGDPQDGGRAPRRSSPRPARRSRKKT